MAADRGGHTPVLTKAVCEHLAVRPGETVVDATIGPGGHARLFAEALGATGTVIGLDVDPSCLALAGQALAGVQCRKELLQSNFAEIEAALGSLRINHADVIFADLGVSSTQLDDAQRGFSFQKDGPLDMRMDPRLTVAAADLVNRLKERELSDLFYYNAQEPASRRIAQSICEARRERRITTTGRLVQAVLNALGMDETTGHMRIHPATRTFLALRIAVNHEISSLERLLAAAPRLLRPDGRFGLIAFHSIEDKPIKMDFRRRSKEGVYRIVTKKPLIADAEERRLNPRARSAKLRVAVRLSPGDEADALANGN